MAWPRQGTAATGSYSHAYLQGSTGDERGTFLKIFTMIFGDFDADFMDSIGMPRVHESNLASWLGASARALLMDMWASYA